MYLGSKNFRHLINQCRKKNARGHIWASAPIARDALCQSSWISFSSAQFLVSLVFSNTASSLWSAVKILSAKLLTYCSCLFVLLSSPKWDKMLTFVQVSKYSLSLSNMLLLVWLHILSKYRNRVHLAYWCVSLAWHSTWYQVGEQQVVIKWMSI